MNQSSLIRTFVLMCSLWAAACGSGSPAPSAAPAATPAPAATNIAEVTGTAPRGAVISLSPVGGRPCPCPKGRQ